MGIHVSNQKRFFNNDVVLDMTNKSLTICKEPANGKDREMPTATLTSKGQITLPKAIRDKFHLHTGDRIEFILRNDEEVVMRPATIDVGELEGILHRSGRPAVTIEEMDAAITEQVSKENR